MSPDDPQRIGPHRLLARLGAGGTGRVYLARTPAGHLSALKVVREDLAHDLLFRKRFAREVRIAGRVHGPVHPRGGGRRHLRTRRSALLAGARRPGPDAAGTRHGPRIPPRVRPGVIA